MTTTHLHLTPAELDAAYDDALSVIEKKRARGKFVALSLLSAALLALLGATYAMYARAPETPARTGTSR